MKAKCISEVAQEAGMAIPTVCKMQARGILPRGDIPMGRLRYYSEELSEQLIHWLRNVYVKHKRGQRFGNVGWILVYDRAADKCDLVADEHTDRRTCLLRVIDGDQVIDRGEYPTVSEARQAINKEVE